MKSSALIVRVMLASLVVGVGASASNVEAAPASNVEKDSAVSWDRATAAHYLDSREIWWQMWPKAQYSHDTTCVSCHTVLPYALARPALRQQMGEQDLAGPERIMFNNVVKRVTLWNDVEPFYKDGKAGPTKSIESRSTEAVLNALILANYDARSGHLTEVTRTAFGNAWALQRHSGDNAGAWIWLNFHNAPWESNESEYWGAALAALAAGIAPDRYFEDPAIQGNLQELRAYLRREYGTQPLVNRIVLLWASAKFSGLLTASERSMLVDSIFAEQQADGGWSLTDLGAWNRRDYTALETKSDGYATGLTVLALEKNGMRKLPQVSRGLMWLQQNQSSSQGLWPAYSLNKKRDPASDPALFMSDAATSYAVLALESGH
jgi:squalene-hopene/tetraprenyl-beta-curcumene cyclase